MKICIVTDAWEQTNGVVTSLIHIKTNLEKKGHEVFFIYPGMWKTWSLPKYKEIIFPFHTFGLAKKIKQINPDAIHITTESLLGLSARFYCVKNNIPFTSSYLTRFPEYIKLYYKIPEWISYKYLKWFHKPSKAVLTPSLSVLKKLEEKKFSSLVKWSGGVEREKFYPREVMHNYKKPVWIYVGRVSEEKNIQAFLQLKLNGTKIIVGDGPAKENLMKQFPDVVFLGKKTEEELYQSYNLGEVFVFPSKTDALGLVNLEAIASGLPVAAYPVCGPKDIIEEGLNGSLSEDLKTACENCLKITDKYAISESIKNWTWENTTEQLLSNLVFFTRGGVE